MKSDVYNFLQDARENINSTLLTTFMRTTKLVYPQKIEYAYYVLALHLKSKLTSRFSIIRVKLHCWSRCFFSLQEVVDGKTDKLQKNVFIFNSYKNAFSRALNKRWNMKENNVRISYSKIRLSNSKLNFVRNF